MRTVLLVLGVPSTGRMRIRETSETLRRLNHSLTSVYSIQDGLGVISNCFYEFPALVQLPGLRIKAVIVRFQAETIRKCLDLLVGQCVNTLVVFDLSLD